MKMPDFYNGSPKNNYVQVSLKVLRDKQLSWKAKGIISTLYGNKIGWKSHFSVLQDLSSDGESSLRSGLSELEKYGYLIRLKCRDKKTKRIIGSTWVYTTKPFKFKIKKLYKYAKNENFEFLKLEKKPQGDFQHEEKSHEGNQVLNIYNNNKIKINKNKNDDKSSSDKSANSSSAKFPKIIKFKKIQKSLNPVPSKKPVPNPNPVELNIAAQKLHKIWVDNGGVPFKTAIMGKKRLNEYAERLLSNRTNPFASITHKENMKKRKFTLAEFENTVKNYFKKHINDTINVADFIYQKGYNSKMKTQSRFLDSFVQMNDYTFKEKTIPAFIHKFFISQIGKPEDMHVAPGIFVNTAKKIEELEKKFKVTSMVHPENQFWYKFMQYVKNEIKENTNFHPAYMCTPTYIDKFIMKAKRNNAIMEKNC